MINCVTKAGNCGNYVILHSVYDPVLKVRGKEERTD